MEGVKMYSKECVIFLNSVTNILDIIKKTGLSPDDVNIIVGNSAENDAQIGKLGDGFIRGRIPLNGEKNKMFTFCTSTAFAGCDFYSDCATSFVISDGKRINTTIDISTDLVQIAGRQRLKESRGYSDEKISDMMKSQCREDEFKNLCDCIIDNNDDLCKTYAQIREELA